jgi:hypothetical protein
MQRKLEQTHLGSKGKVLSSDVHHGEDDSIWPKDTLLLSSQQSFIE